MYPIVQNVIIDIEKFDKRPAIWLSIVGIDLFIIQSGR